MFKKALFLSLFSFPAFASDVPPAMSQYIYNDLMSWVNDARIVAAVTEQNQRTQELSESDVLAQDNLWRAEVGSGTSPMIDAVVNAPLADFLRQHLSTSGGRITEVIVMDHKGLNVAASDVTSDYWQGDEAKYQETFLKGSGAVFIDAIELDQSTQKYQGQVSFSITDPASGNVIGAITVGLDASAFF